MNQPIRPAEAAQGLTRHDLPTPSLLVDLDVVEGNIEKMSRRLAAARVGLRPHVKSHKCPEIARRQLAAGAVGICVATIREAEAMADAGIDGLLITSQMAGEDKTRRLIRLTRRLPRTLSVVDHFEHACRLEAAAGAAGVVLNVLIDIDPNIHRSGIRAGDPAVRLAEQISRMKHLKLGGVQCYSADSSHVVGHEARRKHSTDAMVPAIETFRRVQQSGIPVEIMSGGSTGTYDIDTELPGLTELQAGSYVYLDVDYRRIGGREGAEFSDFGQALTVLATVISCNHPGLATVDAGYKAFATDRPFGPAVKHGEGIAYRFAGDEHGMLDFPESGAPIRLGDRLEFIVPHCDPNVNLYDRVYALRGETVEAVWPIARGYEP